MKPQQENFDDALKFSIVILGITMMVLLGVFLVRFPSIGKFVEYAFEGLSQLN